MSIRHPFHLGCISMDFFTSLSPLSHSALLTSTVAVAIAEIGDKTQLLSLLLAARFANKKALVLGIFVATLVNHAASAWLGAWLGETLHLWLNGTWAPWILASSFIAMAMWVLIPDKESELRPSRHAWGAFLTTFVLFFVAEIGDKTQVATVLLAAEFQHILWVTIGTTLGMLIANVPVIYFGQKLMRCLPLNAARYLTSLLFLAFAIWIVL